MEVDPTPPGSMGQMSQGGGYGTQGGYDGFEEDPPLLEGMYMYM